MTGLEIWLLAIGLSLIHISRNAPERNNYQIEKKI